MCAVLLGFSTITLQTFHSPNCVSFATVLYIILEHLYQWLVTAEKTGQTKGAIASECRHLSAVLTVAANTNRPFTLGLFRPNLAF